MGKGTGRSSITTRNAVVCLGITALAILTLSVVVIVNTRNVMREQAIANTRQNVEALRNQVASRFEGFEAIVLHTAIAAAHFVTPEGADVEALKTLLRRKEATNPYVFDLFVTSNNPWFEPGGFTVFANWEHGLPWNNVERPWFFVAKANPGAIGYTEPYIAVQTNALAISITKNIYDERGVDVGVACVDVDIAFLAELLKKSIFTPGQDVFLINRQGLFVTHPDPEAVLNGDFFDDFGLVHYRAAVLSRESFAVANRDVFFQSETIPGVDWLLVSTVPSAEVFAEVDRFILRLALISVAFLAAAAIVSVAFSYRTLAVPLRGIRGVAGSLAAMDFSVEIKVTENNEIGEMQRAMIKIRDSLKSNLALFNENASRISTAAFDLSSSEKEITATANEQAATVSQIVGAMEGNKNLSAQAAAKTVEVAELAAQTERLSRRGADLHGANERMMSDILGQNAKVVEEIGSLADALSRIGESVQAIDAIADRTKIIAFNAALEASSAGESGKRFAVVAGEIRRFADNVVESVVEIKGRISELRDASDALVSEAGVGSRAIDSGYNRMVEQKEVFENIVDVSQNVAVRSQQISNLSRQQELASAQIFVALKEISAGVGQFVVATASRSATAEALNDMAGKLMGTLERRKNAKGETA